MTESEEIGELKCIAVKDLYKEILNRIKKNCPAGTANRQYIVSIGFSERTYYDIVDFVEKNKIDKRKTKPLHENTLTPLCQKLGIEFKSLMYLVKY